MDIEQILSHFNRDLSGEIRDFADNVSLLDSRYMFVSREKGQQFGYCTHCNRTHRTEDLKQGVITTCPGCGSKCYVKYAGRGRGKLVDQAYFVYYEKSILNPKVLVARGIYAARDYRADYRNVKTLLDTSEYYLFDPENGSAMVSSWYNYFFNHRLELRRSVFSCWHKYCNYNMGLTYSRQSVEEAAQGTSFAWSGWEQYDHGDMISFFDLYTRYPSVEYLTKLGLTNLVLDRLDGQPTYSAINWRGKNLLKVLKMTKQEFKEIRALGVKLDFWKLRMMQLNKKNSYGLTLPEVLKVGEEISPYYYDELLKALKFGTMREIYSYLTKQARKSGSSVSSILGTLKDYYGECQQLEMDLTDNKVRFPAKLHQAHQNNTKKIQYRADKELTKKIQNRQNGLKKLCFELDGLLIRPAASTQELISEGNALNHCVGRYAKRYAEGETDIFLVRLASHPKKPFVTVEVTKGYLKQAYGKDDKPPSKEVEDFIGTWMKKVVNKKPGKKQKLKEAV